MEALKKKQIAFRIAVPIFSTAMFLVMLELVARMYSTVFALPPRTAYDYRIEQPAPYIDAPYFTKEFISESFRQPGGWQYPKDTRLILPNDFRGTYFNVAKGMRSTDFQPANYENSVYLFGGSTIYNSEVPDRFTVASQLQLLFNEHYGSKYVVQNYGTTTVTVSQQLERLTTLSLKSGDIVVFYDGVNDIFQGLFYANPEETMIQRNRQAVKGMSFLQKSMFSLSRRSEFVGLLFDPIDRSIPSHLSDNASMNELLASMKSRFMESILDANDYSSSSKAIFVHCLQPHLFSDNTFSEYETRLSQNFYLVSRGIKEALVMGYPELIEATKELSASIHSYDLSSILNNRANNEEYFLDSCHVNHKANQIIAEQIFASVHQIISPDFLKSSTENTEQVGATDFRIE